MSTAEDLLLLATDPVTGRCLIGATESDAVFGGALLFDLVAADRFTFDGEGRKGRITVRDATPVADPVLERAFARVRHRGRQSPSATVTRLGKHAKRDLYAALTQRGAVRPRGEKFWGVFPLTTYDVLDTSRRDDLLVRVRACLLHDQPADAETGPLIGLLSAGNLVRKFVDKPDRRRAKERAKVVAEGDWASEGVRKAIQAAQGAVTAAMVAVTAAAVAGGS